MGKFGVMDEGNGLNYIRARYYAPDLGRFITKDPLTGKDGDSQSLNRYIYALNNPVRLVDISGLCPAHGKDAAESSPYFKDDSLYPTRRPISEEDKNNAISLSREEFYGVMKDWQNNIETIPTTAKCMVDLNTYMIDSKFHNYNLYYFEGKYVYGHELNYYLQGMLFKHLGHTFFNAVLASYVWKADKAYSYGVNPEDDYKRPGRTFFPSYETLQFIYKGYYDYEKLKEHDLQDFLALN